VKKIITLLTFSVLAIAASAQVTLSQPTQRGNFVIGTRIGFSSAKSSVDVESAAGSVKGDGGSSYQFNIAPGIGYFVTNNFVIGVGMDLINTNSKTGVDLTDGTTAPQESSNNNVLFGPFIRYFIPFGDDKAFFIGSTLGFGNSKNQFTAGNTTQSINTSLLTIGVGPGFTIYSRNGLALEALVKYNFASSNSKIDVQGVQRTSKTWTNAVDFSVGLQYYFGGFRSASTAQ
jgi:Outer membrane protein beta-barrel domain